MSSVCKLLRSQYDSSHTRIRRLQSASVALVILSLSVVSTLGGIRGPGKYNGIVIFDRWGTCYLYSGAYLMPVSEEVKESLRLWEGKPVLVDAQDVYQPMNPGDALIRKLTVLGPAVEPATVPMFRPPDLDGLKLAVAPNFSKDAPDELIVQVRNEGASPRDVRMDALAPTMFAKKRGTESPFEPSDGASFAALTRFDMLFLSKNTAGQSWSVDGKASVTEMSILPGTAVSARVRIEPGQTVEIPLVFNLSPGEYEFLAGYGGGVHAARSMASNQFDFDVDESGKAHLAAGERVSNIERAPRSRVSVCGRVTRDNGNAAENTRVILWPYPFPQAQPSAAATGVADANGWFRLDFVLEGKYVLAAVKNDAHGVLAGAFGARRPADAPPVAIQNGVEVCSFVFTIHRQPGYTVRGQTERSSRAGDVRTVRMILKSGDAFPFESTAVVQADGKYQFYNVPAGRYQFFAGRTGWGDEIAGDVDEKVDILWPQQGKEVEMTQFSCVGNHCEQRTPGEVEKNEILTISALRELHRADWLYSQQYKTGFTASLNVLGPPPEWYRRTSDRAGLVDATKAGLAPEGDATHFTATGYRVTYLPGDSNENGRIGAYSLVARPIAFGETGMRSFLMDASGLIHTALENRAAMLSDPPLADSDVQ